MTCTESDQSKNTFQFTIGPVQGFVSQARRTRDFWAGSFLLSWLAGVAMVEIKRQGGEIQFPVPSPNYLEWIDAGKSKGEPPRQGSIPNRFKAVQAKVPADFNGDWVVQSVRQAWIALAEHIWRQDGLDDVIAPTSRQATRAIWDRQHQGFWDISWVIAPENADSSLMDQRKNWRVHHTPTEPGVKCMVMDGWQELSGSQRPGKEGNDFWCEVRKGKETDIGPKEQLCALAYVKRRFARHFHNFKATLPHGLTVHGWRLETGMPSVSYMAAVHWLAQVVQAATRKEAEDLLDAAREVSPSQDEWDTRILCLEKAAGDWNNYNEKRYLLSLDASVFFDHVQDNPNAYGLDAQAIQNLRQEMRRFGKAHPHIDPRPTPFYAILLMDGDSLGIQMSKKENQKPISDALKAFTTAVPKVVSDHNGMLIYAGGDDVLAVLPLEDALRCAAKVREKYMDSFKSSGIRNDIQTTISAAIEFAHVKMPLGKVLADAHDLLDNIAKDGAGRDAVAVRVWKTGRMTLQWAQPWRVALDEEDNIQVEKLAHSFQQRDAQAGHVAAFSNKFFFKIRERFELLNPKKEDVEPVLNSDQAIDLLAVDYVNSAENRKEVDMTVATSIIRPLLTQCRAVTRNPQEDNIGKWKRSNRLSVDGALLVRFLAQKGVEA